jgi:hypothetical protein
VEEAKLSRRAAASSSSGGGVDKIASTGRNGTKRMETAKLRDLKQHKVDS